MKQNLPQACDVRRSVNQGNDMLHLNLRELARRLPDHPAAWEEKCLGRWAGGAGAGYMGVALQRVPMREEKVLARKTQVKHSGSPWKSVCLLVCFLFPIEDFEVEATLGCPVKEIKQYLVVDDFPAFASNRRNRE